MKTWKIIWHGGYWSCWLLKKLVIKWHVAYYFTLNMYHKNMENYMTSFMQKWYSSKEIYE